MFNIFEAASSTIVQSLITTKQYLENTRISSYGTTTNSLPMALTNLARNGDLGSNIIDNLGNMSWISRAVGAVYKFKANNGSLSGQSLELTLPPSRTTSYFYGLPAPVKGIYTCGLRFKKYLGQVE
ncbi:hypothetical protein F6Y05_02550 [Bacillus megaterium]|nr:hypothetical protein [Priestia megaterium]